MAGSVNKVILIGNLGRDPEVRSAQDGSKVATLSIATTEAWKDLTTGARRERTEWHRVVIFNDRICDVAEKYIKKGTKVFLEGQLQTRKWTDQESGQERYTKEVILSKFRGELTILDRIDNEPSSSNDIRESSFSSTPNAPASFPTHADLHDDIPF